MISALSYRLKRSGMPVSHKKYPMRFLPPQE